MFIGTFLLKDLERFKIDNGSFGQEWICTITVVSRAYDHNEEKKNKFESWSSHKEINSEDLKLDVCDDSWWNGNTRKKRKKNIKIQIHSSMEKYILC